MRFHNSIAKLACLIFICIYPSQIYAQLDLTEEEKEFIQSNPTINLGYDENWTPFEYTDGDRGFSGLAKEYISHIAKVTGLKFKATSFENWPEILEALENGELDISMSMHPTKERKEYLNFSTPYFYSESVYLFRKGEDINRSISNSEDLKVGTLKNGFIAKYLDENFPKTSVSLYHNVEAGIEALRNGEIDSYIENRIVLHHQITKRGINDVEIGAQLKGVSGMKISIGSRKELTPLNSIINKALASLSPERKRFINSKWISFSKNSNTHSPLTDLEKDWLKKHPEINCYIKDNQPYLMWSKNASGITTEVLNFIAQSYNFKINYIYANSKSEAYTKLENKSCVDIFPIFEEVPVQQNNIEVTKPYISSSLVIFANKNESFIHSMEDLYGKTVAISKQLGLKEKLKQEYPNIKIIEYTSRIKALKDLNSAKVDGYLGLNITGEYIIRHHQFTNVNMVAPTNFPTQEFRFALNSENWVLASILNKGISEITNEKLSLFSHKYFSQASNKGFHQILTIVTLLCVTVIVFIFWTGFLKGKVKKQTKKIRESKYQLKLHNKNLEKLVEKRTLDIRNNEQKLEHISKLSNNGLSLTKSGFWHYDFTQPKSFQPSEKILELKGIINTNNNSLLLKKYYYQMLKADRKLAKKTFRAFIDAQNKTVFKATYKFKRPSDGNNIWIKSKAEVVKDESGKNLFMYGVSQDISVSEHLLEKVAEEKQFSENIINLIPNGLSIFSVQNGYTYLSSRATEILGYTFDDLKYNATNDELDKIHPEDRDKFLQHVNLIKEAPESQHLTVRVKHKNGHYLWIKETHLPFEFDSNGKVLSVLGVIEDITELKEKETQINHEKELSEILTKISSQYINCPIDQVDTAIFSALEQIAQFIKADKALIYEYHGKNKKCTPLTEWPSSTLNQNSPSSDILPCVISEEIHKNHENGEHFIIHDTCIGHEQPIFDYIKENKIKSLLSVPFFRDKKLRGFIEFNFINNTHSFLDWEINLLKVFAEVLSNISARLKTERDTQEQHDYLKTLIQSIPAAVFAKDLTGTYTLANNQTLKFADSKEEEYIGKSDYELYPSELAKGFIEDDKELFSTNKATNKQEKLYDKLGNLQAVYEVAKNPVKNSKGETIGLIGISREITERVNQEIEIKKNSDHLKKLIEVSSYNIEDIFSFLNFSEEQAMHITDSQLSCLMMYNEDTGNFTLSGPSHEAEKNNKTENNQFTEQLKELHIWEEIVKKRHPIIINDYKVSPHVSKDTINNHTTIKRLLSVPVFSKGKIVAVVCVANKSNAYSHSDEVQLKLLMDYVWKKFEAHQTLIKLKEAKDHLDFALDAANMGTWTYDIPNETIELNADCLELFKSESKSLKYTKNEYLELIHPEDTNGAEMTFLDTITNNKKKYYVTYRLAQKDGSFIHITKSGEIQYSKDGTPISANGLIWDVSEIKTKEIAIKRLQENLEQILNSIPIGVAIMDRKTKAPLFMNDTIKDMLEIDQNDIYQFDNSAFYKHKAELTSLTQILDKNNKFTNREIEFVSSKTKKDFWAKTTVTRGNFLDEETSLVSLYDITENKELELKLRRSNEQINSATKAANIGSWDFRPIANQLYTNDTFVTMLGYPISEKVDSIESWSKLVHPEDIYWVSNKLEPHFEGTATEKYDVQYRMLHRQGHYIWVRDVGEVIEKNNDGKCERFIGFQIDISAQVEMQHSIENARLKAEEANKAKSVFLANMSHEIRTPMNAIIGFSEILSQQIKKPSNLNYLNSIQSSGKTLLGIINDILDISKIEAGKTEIKSEETALTFLINEVASMFEIKSHEKQIDFKIDIDSRIPKYLFIDELRLRQVLINLINNAFKFTDNGTVSLKVTQENLTTDTVDLTIEIKDSGIGIAKKDLRSIFQSFQQVEDHDTRKYGGTGLGLSISKQLITLMNGNLLAESKLGEGSTFTISLPEVKVVKNYNQIIPEYCKTRLRNLNFSGSKVLIVDDITDNRNVIKGYLQSYDLKIIEAENGKKAIEMVTIEKPDIILMDLRMPIMSGYDAGSVIKNDPAKTNTPIIALTASSLNTKAEIETQGFDGFIRKPLLFEELIETLTRFLPFTEETLETEDNSQLVLSENAMNNKDFQTLINELYFIKENQWDSLSKSIRLKGAKLFISELQQLNSNHQLQHLTLYIESLNNAVQIFDINEVEKLVLDYPNFILSLQSNVKQMETNY